MKFASSSYPQMWITLLIHNYMQTLRKICVPQNNADFSSL